jgi:hypothetical protein
MPRFFFDFRQGDDYTPDTDGNEFASTEQAYLEAMEAAREMWSELLRKRRDPTRCGFEVRDAKGNLLFLFPFQEVMDSCVDRRPKPPLFIDHRTATATATATAARVDHANRGFRQELHKIRETLAESRALLEVEV